MALSVSTQVNPIATKMVLQTSATATADNNIIGASGTLYMIDIDNTANATQDVYVKLYNDNAPTVGTTVPDFVLLCKQNVRRQYAMVEGVSFITGVSMCCVTTGGTVGTTSPTNPVIVRMLIS